MILATSGIEPRVGDQVIWHDPCPGELPQRGMVLAVESPPGAGYGPASEVIVLSDAGQSLITYPDELSVRPRGCPHDIQ